MRVYDMKARSSSHFSFEIATAIRQSLKDYNFSLFRHDLLAAFVVSMVALPLSMALSIAVGLPPQHGLYTAIVAGIVVPLLGGSMMQVSGPTAAFVVILAPIVAQFGLHGIVWCNIIAGMMLILMGVARFGKLINYVPYPVTTGFTAGIAVVIGTLALNDFFGLGVTSLGHTYTDKLVTIISHLHDINVASTLVGVITLLFLFTGGKISRFIPAAIVAMVVGTVLSLVLSSFGYGVETIGSRFSWTDTTGNIIPGIPPYPPVFHMPTFKAGELLTIPDFHEFRQLLFPAFAIAILGAIESLLSATVADSMKGTKHNPNAELNAIGIGNILSGLVAGISATGAIARTAVNINNGGRTPISSSLHAVFILIYMMIAARYISYIPMASLAALLIHTAYRMSHYRQFARILTIAPRSDTLVLLACFFLTVLIDMVAGVSVGMVLAAFLLMKRVTELTHVEVENKPHPPKETPLWDEMIAKHTLVYRIKGPLFFGTIEKAFDQYEQVIDPIECFIVDLSNVPFIDMTGLVAMKSMLASVANEKREVRIVSDNQDVVGKIRKKIDDLPQRDHVHFHKTLHTAMEAK